MDWDVKLLETYASSPVGKVNEKYGFKRVKIMAPVQMESASMQDMVTSGPSMVDVAREALGRPAEAEVHSVTPTPEAPIEDKGTPYVAPKKKPGRKPKVAVV
jgi:hypothetical protein